MDVCAGQVLVKLKNVEITHMDPDKNPELTAC